MVIHRQSTGGGKQLIGRIIPDLTGSSSPPPILVDAGDEILRNLPVKARRSRKPDLQEGGGGMATRAHTVEDLPLGRVLAGESQLLEHTAGNNPGGTTSNLRRIIRISRR